jgi:hypothetical protein
VGIANDKQAEIAASSHLRHELKGARMVASHGTLMNRNSEWFVRQPLTNAGAGQLQSRAGGRSQLVQDLCQDGRETPARQAKQSRTLPEGRARRSRSDPRRSGARSRRLDAGRDVRLAQDLRDGDADGLDADEERVGDLAVCQALGPARVRGKARSHAFEVGDGFELSIGGFRFVAQPSCVAV